MRGDALGWMRMMGAESVEYHRATVLGRADDHPGMAMEYYASRGETPLVWGGSGAAALGLSGPVTAESYEAVFGAGGASDPRTGERLVHTRRPGMEVVIFGPQERGRARGDRPARRTCTGSWTPNVTPRWLTSTRSPGRWAAGAARPPKRRRRAGLSMPTPAMPPPGLATPARTTIFCLRISWR